MKVLLFPRLRVLCMRLSPTLVSFAAAFTVALAAGAARADDCPDGDWFCEPSESEPPPGPPAEPEPTEPPERMRLDPPRPHRSRRIEFEPRPPPHRHHPRKTRRPLHPWGFDAHVFGALLGDGGYSTREVSMGGLGVGLRYRFLPEFALEGDLELGFGADYNGYDRQEGALLLHAVGTLNPRSPVRLNLLAGFGLSAARVSVGSDDPSPLWPAHDENYSYFGMDLGASVEVSLSPRTAIHGDLLGFVRDRTDKHRKTPEFVDPETGRATNASGGGLLRVGAIFYW